MINVRRNDSKNDMRRRRMLDKAVSQVAKLVHSDGNENRLKGKPEKNHWSLFISREPVQFGLIHI